MAAVVLVGPSGDEVSVSTTKAFIHRVYNQGYLPKTGTIANAMATLVSGATTEGAIYDYLRVVDLVNRGSSDASDRLFDTFLAHWAPGENVVAGDYRVNPSGAIVKRVSGGTSRSTYDATEAGLWTIVAGGGAGGAHTHHVTDLTATGTRDSTTYLRGDNTWAVPPGGGGGGGDATTTSKGVVQLAGDLAGTAAAPTVPDLANRVPTSRLISTSNGLTGGGDLSANRNLAVSYGSTSGTAVQGNDARVTADQSAGTASIRTLGTGATQAAAGNHTHADKVSTDGTTTSSRAMTRAAYDALATKDPNTLYFTYVP